jgi:5-formyltetrahydrofolate cyclo-ligase
MAQPEVSARSEQICRRLISDEFFGQAATIGLYWPIKNEVITESIFCTAIGEKKKVGFPRAEMSAKRIVYSAVSDLALLTPGAYGIMEPRPDHGPAVVPYAELDLVVVPGVVFDERGFRVGYGGGFFDRLLSEKKFRARTAALAFDFQVIKRIPEQEHDRPVDIVFTESRVIRCA